MPRIVLLGEPGSGKSTLAKALARQLRATVVEASVTVIRPTAAMTGRWPNGQAMLEALCRPQKNGAPRISRKQAMETYRRLQTAYSPDFIARALHARHPVRSKDRTVVFAGLRGYDNAAYCRLHDDFLVYLEADRTALTDRLVKNRGYGRRQAMTELKDEQALYRTRSIRRMAHMVVDTTKSPVAAIARHVARAVRREYRMCRRCVNSARNPAIAIGRDGLCQICRAYRKHFDPKHLRAELEFLRSFKKTGPGRYDVMVGISGGKDSTATLATLMKMGFRPLAFTFDLGYLPKTTVPRARQVAARLGADFVAIDIRPHIRQIDRVSYRKTAALYDLPLTLAAKSRFLAAYAEGRKHYSVRCRHSPAFVRTCQLCRRTVIRSYHAEATKRGIPAVILGINEWTNLSAAQQGGAYRVSGVRTLRPTPQSKPVHVFHLPFLLQQTSRGTRRILRSVGWRPPQDEAFIESNSNSCLFARAAELTARQLLGFHPDSTRLAREVTVGFLSRRQALKALEKIHPYGPTPRQVLKRAGILK